jgi:hypothetical protein
MTPRRTDPAISILVDHPGDDRLLDRALDGFDRQSIAPRTVERIVVDRRKYQSRGEARQAAVAAARAPLLLFFDGRCWPMPGLLEYCLEVHDGLPSPADALLIGVTADASLRRDPLLHWQTATRRFPDRPSSSGVFGWPHFKTSALACKRALFAEITFDPRFDAGEDTELASRLIRAAPLKVWYQATAQAVWLAAPALTTALEDEYRDGYFRRVRVQRDRRARMLSDVEDRFAFAERFVIPHAAEVRTLETSLQGLGQSLAGVELAFATGDDAERLALMHQMYETLFAHAAARGWLDAEHERPVAARSIWDDAPRAQRVSKPQPRKTKPAARRRTR